jgi:uncharacterized cupin superfamily protein
MPKKIMALYDSLTFMTQSQNIVWPGGTGVGKSGLASSFLIHATGLVLVDRSFVWTAPGARRQLRLSLSYYDMRVAKLSEVPAREVRSPQGKYHLVRQSISQALGGLKDVGTWGGGHPFDVEYFRQPSGAVNFPFHAHSAQWEMYIFVKGRGSVRGPESTIAIEEGQSIIFKPGEAHQILNTSENELCYFVVADHCLADVITYSDTGKWVIKPQQKCFILTETSYYEPAD